MFKEQPCFKRVWRAGTPDLPKGMTFFKSVLWGRSITFDGPGAPYETSDGNFLEEKYYKKMILHE